MKMCRKFFSFLWLIFAALPASAGLFGKNQPAFLPADQAFVFSFNQQNENWQLNWQIADGYYLYKKEIHIEQNGEPLAALAFPAAEIYDDEFFGQVEIYRQQLSIGLPTLPQGTSLTVNYQGCTKGFCYPPESKTIQLVQADQISPNSAKPAENTPVTPTVAEQDHLADRLAKNPFSIFWFFVLGLGLAFTPCVLPMLPLLSAIVLGGSSRPNSPRALMLSFTYVQGMAFTYTLLGLTVAAIGLPFQIALQSSPVLIGLSILFTLLALSMFGLFEIRLPNSWQQKLTQFSQQQQSGSFWGVLVMGMIAGLVASPCTSAPLSGALLYVAQSGDLLTGGLALYLLALGMGVPLMLITLFGNRILPKSGEWLLSVKTAFGFVMLALPVFLISRIMPKAEVYLWSALAIIFLAWLIEQFHGKHFAKRAVRLILIALLAISSKPWIDLVFNQVETAEAAENHHFSRINSLAELEQNLTAYQGKKVMLDFYADWCVACKEFEKYTFSDKNVQNHLQEMHVLQVDMTKNSPQNEELMKKFGILGLPTILFFDEQGKELSHSRITGFLPAQPFAEWLKKL